MQNQLFARKSLKVLLDEMAGEHRLRRVLGPVTLTALGIGAVIGAGIFVATGAAARDVAGPALMVSYLVAGITCIFAALCYAEFASMAPVAGSAYTYAYTTMGELFAWIIGWDLVLEYAVGAATVANGWSGYFQSVLLKLGIAVPITLSGAPHKYDQGHILPNLVAEYEGVQVTQRALTARQAREAKWPAGTEPAGEGIYWVRTAAEGGQTVIVGRVGDPSVEARIQNHQRALINLPAILVVLVVTAVLVKGIKESAGFNALMVAIKVAAVLFVIAVGAFFVNPENWTRDFAPYGWTGVSFFGIPVLGKSNPAGEPVGVLAGAAIIFFAYIGFDSVSTHAEEARNPQRDVPIGIIASLLICTVLYVGVVAVLTGMVPYQELSKDAGVSDAFKRVGLAWAEFIIAVAGVAGITSVLLVMMLSAPRVFLAMARDGLVPRRIFASVHPTFKTPWISTMLIGAFVAGLTGFLPIDALLHLTNIGTLFAFVIVCAAVLIMRHTNPEAARPFRCPLVPVIPALGIGTCLLLMLSLPAANWWRLLAWLGLGLCIYFFYGRHHSTLGQELRGEISRHGVSPAGQLAPGTKP
ncbi:MAG TPA: amino acid permease [Gemmataceae bacterium]|jgi:APA family basic amino acid/polyamine antiporter|nr:amino acid permease [Gemmataceae bacterium]